MTKPDSIFKRSNGFYYAQFPFSTDGKVFQKSTGCKNRGEAEKTVLKWYSQGTVLPVRTKRLAVDEEKISLERLSFFCAITKNGFLRK